ncbi:flagellar transcriptional regulator FlhD [Burkholderia vietnamiensis]|uniref:flagellar transcriptional regulator FlhD n=1 Tax=Burkholderia vietnamiensis TaxID=60552 RepID=UPI001CF14995|nr:flagellar transcriptional regulator FlhD [Burkholderia vietnamiensis]MCA8198531.1 flagellar transcriptional regulator FlhD [Burkholderia vietnamiensis]
MNLPSDLLNEIKEQNLSYLVLAQRLLQQDREMGMYRLGFSSEVASIIEKLTFAQVVKLATSTTLLCRFRFDDHAILAALADKGVKSTPTVLATHAAIVLAGQSAEQVN